MNLMTDTVKILHAPGTRLLVCLVVLFQLCGCGPGSGQGLDESGDLIGQPSGGDPGDSGNGGSTGASGNPDAKLGWLQANVYGGVCSQCHTGAGAPLGVDWSSESSSCSNVGRTSGEIPTMLVVDSGNPDGSYVIWKLEGAGPNGEPIVGARMPLSNPPLTAEAMQNMRDWISDDTPGCQSTQTSGIVDATATKAGDPGSTSSVDESIYPAGSWSYVWTETLQVCATCHSLNPINPSCVAELQCPPQGMVLSVDNYFGLVDGFTVAPFDPDASKLWRRVTHDNPHERMPLGLSPLDQRQLDIIRNWIEAGAPFCPETSICP